MWHLQFEDEALERVGVGGQAGWAAGGRRAVGPPPLPAVGGPLGAAAPPPPSKRPPRPGNPRTQAWRTQTDHSLRATDLWWNTVQAGLAALSYRGAQPALLPPRLAVPTANALLWSTVLLINYVALARPVQYARVRVPLLASSRALRTFATLLVCPRTEVHPTWAIGSVQHLGVVAARAIVIAVAAFGHQLPMAGAPLGGARRMPHRT